MVGEERPDHGPPDRPEDPPEDRLLDEGLLRRDDAGLHTTRRWQAAVMRAVRNLVDEGHDDGDIRVPMVRALLERFPDATDADVARMLAVVLPVERDEAGWDAVPTAPSGGP